MGKHKKLKQKNNKKDFHRTQGAGRSNNDPHRGPAQEHQSRQSNKHNKLRQRHTKKGSQRPRGGGPSHNRPRRAPAQEYKPRQPNLNRICLREKDIGVTEYVSSTAGFTAVVKSRYSDFHVNEIDMNGKVLQLTDLKVPQLKEKTLNKKEIEDARSQFKDLITTAMWDNIEQLAKEKFNDKTAQSKHIDIDVTDLDKDNRTQIHKVLKQLYPHKLVSTTLNEKVELDERKILRIMKPKGHPGENRIEWTFPGEYVHFLLHKENYDTTEIATTIANRLNLRPSQVNYCGTKDKRAKTTQKFCIKRRLPNQIMGATKLRNVHVGNFEFSNEVLKLGDLKGNRFRIALRHLNGDEKEIEKSLISLRDNGFINYFGLQRFGNCSTAPTYEIGLALMKSDYKTACELILKPRENENNFMVAIREQWWQNRDSAAAAAMFHNDKRIEKKILDGLVKYGENDYAAALRRIPRNMLLLYPHAFQSLIFNRIVTRRIKKFGLDVIVGDLVYRDKEDSDEGIEFAVLEDDTETGITSTKTTDNTENDAKADNDTSTENKDDAVTEPSVTESVFKRKVKALTAEDVASGNYTRFDIVLPLPGYDITYPANEVGPWYEELMQEYGMSSEKLRHNVKTFAMAGAYRKLLIQPAQLSWQFRTYDTLDRTLIASDWEMLMNKKKIEPEIQGGQFKALILDFCLPPSVYATMLLREILKTDTSASHQTELEQTEMGKYTADGEKTEDAAAATEKRKASDKGNSKDESEVVSKKIKVDSKKV